MSLSDWPPRMVAPRAGTEVRQVSKAPQLCTGCSKPECWANGCQDKAAVAEPAAPPPPATAAPSPAPAPVTTWQPLAAASTAPAGTPAPTSAPEDGALTTTHQQEAESPMSKKPKQGRNLQRVLCEALAAAGGTMTREELRDALGFGTTPFRNASYNAQNSGRIAHLKDGDRFTLTKTGRAWLAEGVAASGDEQPKTRKTRKASAKKAPAKRRGAPRKAKAATAHKDRFVPALQKVVEIAAEVVATASASFRCGVFSDGGFHLAKNGQSIELTPEECREMQRYLARNKVEMA